MGYEPDRFGSLASSSRSTAPAPRTSTPGSGPTCRNSRVQDPLRGVAELQPAPPGPERTAHRRTRRVLLRGDAVRARRALRSMCRVPREPPAGTNLEATELWASRCWVCAKPGRATDHVIALCNGGTNWPANLRPICASCNGAKSGVESRRKLTVPEIMAWAVVRRATRSVRVA